MLEFSLPLQVELRLFKALKRSQYKAQVGIGTRHEFATALHAFTDFIMTGKMPDAPITSDLLEQSKHSLKAHPTAPISSTDKQ